MKQVFSSTLLAVVALISLQAWGSSVARIDAKKSLNLVEGDYLVVAADSGFQKENFCVKDLIHTIHWIGPTNDPTLSLGAVSSYSDFNTGLITDSQPYYAHHCVYRRSTQAQPSKLMSDVFTNCDNGNATTHSELVVNGETIEFSAELKVSRDRRVPSISSKCTLRKIVKKATVPADLLLDTPGM